MDQIDERIQTPEVARITGLSIATIQKMRRTGEFPGWEEVSANRKVIRRSLVAAWMQARTRARKPKR